MTDIGEQLNQRHIYAHENAKTTTEFPEEYHDIIEFGILSSQTNPFDPMEKAIVKLGYDFLEHTEHIHTNVSIQFAHLGIKEVITSIVTGALTITWFELYKWKHRRQINNTQ